MTKVYQTVVDKGKGNCMQAAVASLFDLPLKKVPDFTNFGTRWFSEFYLFIKKHDYDFWGTLYNPKTPGTLKRIDRFPEIKNMPGVNGYFLASVYSPKFYDKKDKHPTTHAIVIDKNFNVAHDPNREYSNVKYPEYEKLGYGGILDIWMVNPIETL